VFIRDTAQLPPVEHTIRSAADHAADPCTLSAARDANSCHGVRRPGPAADVAIATPRAIATTLSPIAIQPDVLGHRWEVG
jgi:hypothetical protein